MTGRNFLAQYCPCTEQMVSPGRALAGSVLLALLGLVLAAPVAPEPAPHPQAPAAQGSANWLPIDPADIALKDNPRSPGSHAMILEREVIVDDPGRYVSEYTRMKIFDEEGKDNANVEIPYVDSIEDVVEIEARTINADGSFVPFQGQVFDQDIVKYKKAKYRAKVFTLPEVQVGSIIEYKYKFRWKKDPPEAITKPAKMTYTTNYVASFRAASWIVQTDLYLRHGHFVFRPFPKAHLQFNARMRTNQEKPEGQFDGSYEMHVKDFPAYHDEGHMPPEDALRARVDFYYLVGPVFSHDNFWFHVGSQIAYISESFLSKHKRADRVAAETVAAGDTPEVKLKKLYARAQQVRFLTCERSRTGQELKQEHLAENKSVDDVLEHGYAFANEVNYLFIALARAAGFDASPALVSSRSDKFFLPSLLDPGQLNANVVMVQKGTDAVYFDPATCYCPYGVLPWEETWTRGVRIATNAGIVSVPAPVSKDAIVERKARLHLGADGALEGKLEVTFQGQYALQWKLSARNEDTAGRRNELQDAAKEWLPAGSKVEVRTSSGWDSTDDPVRAEFDVKIPDQALKTQKRLLLPVAVTISGETNPLPFASRTYPVYFRFPHQETDEIRIEFPAGYELEALPKPRKFDGPSANYEMTSTQEGKELVTKRKMVVDGFYYETRFYTGIRMFFSGVITDDKDRAVFKTTSAHPAQ